MKIRNFAAIDIGSNAVRLLISYVIEENDKPVDFRKYTLVRVPIRLGQDVFLNGEISEDNKQRLIKAISSFSLLMDVYKVENYRACATSAMREAKNSKEVVEEIDKKTKVNVEIIDGSKEANIIAINHLGTVINDKKNYLYMDVGGGSTEFTIYSRGEVIASKSFKIGTLRLLNNTITSDCWKEIKIWIKSNTKNINKISLVGSGGNINKIFKTFMKKKDVPLPLSALKNYYKLLKSYTYEERIKRLKLNPDRADVIVHASNIFLKAMKWSNSNQIYVPEIGLSDGIVKDMYFKLKKS